MDAMLSIHLNLPPFLLVCSICGVPTVGVHYHQAESINLHAQSTWTPASQYQWHPLIVLTQLAHYLHDLIYSYYHEIITIDDMMHTKRMIAQEKMDESSKKGIISRIFKVWTLGGPNQAILFSTKQSKYHQTTTPNSRHMAEFATSSLLISLFPQPWFWGTPSTWYPPLQPSLRQWSSF